MNNNKIYIIKSTRISLLKHLNHYFKSLKIPDTDVKIINIHRIHDINKYLKTISENKVKYIVYSNGTDVRDRETKKIIIKENPEQNFIFSENAWLPWSKYIYADPTGIGNESELFDYTTAGIESYKINENKIKEATLLINKELSRGIEIKEQKDYILVPLQVDNDSKLIIGSPDFKNVKSFVEYIIDTTPKNVNILFKNHPQNKHKCKIPKVDNVYDITYEKYCKKSLIENSLFVAGINTTFLIESMYLLHKTVTYGLDVFSNKNIIIEGYNKSFNDILKENIDVSTREKFIKILMSRQIKKV